MELEILSRRKICTILQMADIFSNSITTLFWYDILHVRFHLMCQWRIIIWKSESDLHCLEGR